MAETTSVPVQTAALPSGFGFFRLLYGQSLIYNQCWEDPAVDRQALDLTADDRVMVITSAGCNALDYALTGARVLAVDANPRQNHLLELKLAGIAALDFASFFDLFGNGGTVQWREMYGDALRPRLSPAARAFWDVEVGAFDPSRSRGGSFYYSGTAGLVALAIRAYIDHLARLGGEVHRLLAASGIEDQRRIWRDRIEPRLLSRGVLRLLGSGGALALLGVPAPQRAMVRAHEGGFDRFLRQALDRVLSVALLRENYFWLAYLTGRYSREVCPEYLKRASFDRLKAGLADRIRWRTGTVADCLRTEIEPITAFVLLDHMDWLAERPAMLAEEWNQIFARATPAARLIFRSGGSDASFLPPSVAQKLAFEGSRAAALHRQDRVGTYGSFHLARLRVA